VRVLPVAPDDLLALDDEVVELYAAAFGAPSTAAGPADLAAFRASLARQVRKPGFRACTARSADGRLVGFAYGWEGGPGDWWWDIAASAVNGDVRRRWFADCFVIAELPVLPAARRQGIGRTLLDTLLAATERPAAVLSVRADADAALAFYAARGWRRLASDVRFPGSDAAWLVLGYLR
jgi:ribosomal protein S18 acetylase RimI-like enzyme